MLTEFPLAAFVFLSFKVTLLLGLDHSEPALIPQMSGSQKETV